VISDHETRVFIAKAEAKEFGRALYIAGGIQNVILATVLAGMAWYGVSSGWIICYATIMTYFFLTQLIVFVVERLDAGRSWTEQAVKQLLEDR
jgi:hypothetical protein